jgi:hypothetical protein
VRAFEREEAFVTVRLLIGFVIVVAVAGPAAAQTSSKPADSKKTVAHRTPWGHPDLQGVWANNVATPMERPKELADRATLTDQEVANLKAVATRLFDGNGDAAFGDSVFLAALRTPTKYTSTDGQTGNYNSFWVIQRQFDNRTSLVTDPDGKIPAMTPDAQKRAAAVVEKRKEAPAGPEALTLSLRCISFGLPNTFAGYNSTYQIIQTPDTVVIATEMIHDARIIPLDGRPHLASGIRQWLGDSRGHWEGDTLVVDTTNFVDQSFNGVSTLRVNGDQNMHLTERFTRVGNTLQYSFTIDDPTMWTKPWSAMIPLQGISEHLYEYACHEGNISMGGILRGARANEKSVSDGELEEGARKGSN